MLTLVGPFFSSFQDGRFSFWVFYVSPKLLPKLVRVLLRGLWGSEVDANANGCHKGSLPAAEPATRARFPQRLLNVEFIVMLSLHIFKNREPEFWSWVLWAHHAGRKSLGGFAPSTCDQLAGRAITWEQIKRTAMSCSRSQRPVDEQRIPDVASADFAVASLESALLFWFEVFLVLVTEF